jgi:hypothetical protein
MDDEKKLISAQWILERNLAWIAAAEIKVGVIVSVHIAMLGGLAAAFSNSTHKSQWAFVCTFAAGPLEVAALFCAAMAVMPRLGGPAQSLLFFSKIASQNGPDYARELKSASAADLLADWSAQIHRNAEIACDKHRWVKRSVAWSFLSVIPWIGAIALLVKA